MQGFDAIFADHMANVDCPAAMRRDKQEAFFRFSRSVPPTPKSERWRYTDAAAVLRDTYQSAFCDEASDVETLLKSQKTEYGHKLVFVAGRFSPRYSTSSAELGRAGITVLSLAEGLYSSGKNALQVDAPSATKVDADEIFQDLGRAFLGDGAVIQVASGRKIEAPLQIIHVYPQAQQRAFATYQIFLKVGRGAAATWTESAVSADHMGFFVNGTVHVELEEDALLTGYLVRPSAGESTFVHEMTLDLKSRAQAMLHVVSSGGRICRQGIRAHLRGEEARFEVNALGLLTAGMQLDNQIDVTHHVPHTTSRQLFKQIVGKRARAAFEGHIYVTGGARKTDAYQLNRTMLLDATAQFAVKPQLYINNADVRCTHGAATGRISEEEIFYLTSRGISRASAYTMLCRAFAAEITGKIDDRTVAARVESMIADTLEP